MLLVTVVVAAAAAAALLGKCRDAHGIKHGVHQRHDIEGVKQRGGDGVQVRLTAPSHQHRRRSHCRNRHAARVARWRLQVSQRRRRHAAGILLCRRGWRGGRDSSSRCPHHSRRHPVAACHARRRSLQRPARHQHRHQFQRRGWRPPCCHYRHSIRRHPNSLLPTYPSVPSVVSLPSCAAPPASIAAASPDRLHCCASVVARRIPHSCCGPAAAPIFMRSGSCNRTITQRGARQRVQSAWQAPARWNFNARLVRSLRRPILLPCHGGGMVVVSSDANGCPMPQAQLHGNAAI